MAFHSAFAILAVGVTSTSLIAALGALGVLVSMFVFIILGLPSAGATVPLQATPAFFEWLAKFEPMTPSVLGRKGLLYLGGRADAGLSQSVELTAGGLVIGVLLGVVVTRLYDRRDYHHRVSTAPVADTPDCRRRPTEDRGRLPPNSRAPQRSQTYSGRTSLELRLNRHAAVMEVAV